MTELKNNLSKQQYELMSTEEKVELFQYRVGSLAGGMLYVFFGWYSETFVKVAYDGLVLRLPILVIGLIVFFLSFKRNFPLKYLRFLFLFGTCFGVYQYVGIFAQSNYNVYFSVGLMAMPFITFSFYFHIVDMFIYYVFALVCGILMVHDINRDFATVYLIDGISSFCIYVFIIKRRVYLLQTVTENFKQLTLKQGQIEEKNRSLIKIGELATQVAHDIRSPVTALEAVSQILGDEIDPRKKRLIENAAKRVNEIANNLVSEYRENLTKDLSAINIGRTISLNSLIEDIVEEKKLSLDHKHQITFKAVETISLPSHLDSTEFQRVISNLLNNAIEAFNKEHGIIDIQLYRKNEKIQITIRDNGVGIPEEQITNVFKQGVSGKAKGAGLGLTHAKQYIESIGGHIALESIPNNQTTIAIEI